MKKITILKLSILLLFPIILCSCAGDDKQENSPSSISIKTIEVKNITEKSATISANIELVGMNEITVKGICISINTNPTIENLKIEEKGNAIGQFNFSFQNLNAITKYYARSYVLTNSGIIYGNEISFVTTQNTKPIVSTGSVTLITSKTAITSGTIVNKGTSDVVGYGVYISSTNVIPTTTDRDVQGVIDSNKFICSLANLEPDTKYYIRAYAINNSGISFGEVMSFTTEKVGLPTIITNQPSSIYTSTAKVGGTILSDGGSKFLSVGVCISAVSPIPTTADAKTDVTSPSENVFEINLNDLKANTKYYTRAYGTNGLGTFYGEVIVFTTKAVGVPVLKISALSGSGLTASSGASVINNGGDVITSYGFVWSKFENPDITWQNVYKTKQEGTFPNLTYFNGTLMGGIFPNTTHYVRAYATNSYGTGYSPPLTFTTGKN
ncbi:fibronectin type III domain-containing protein [Flavobacterium piscis]|nr:fibronectin type III domain-containing protein [Flavobacterium piscis]